MTFPRRRNIINFKFNVCHILSLKKQCIKENVEKCLSSKLNSKTSTQSRKKKQDNTHVIAIIMLYENRKSLIFNVLVVVVYIFSEKYVYVDYLILQLKIKVVITQGIWRYFFRWALRNYNTRTFIKHCSLLWYCSRW